MLNFLKLRPLRPGAFFYPFVLTWYLFSCAEKETSQYVICRCFTLAYVSTNNFMEVVLAFFCVMSGLGN